MLLHTGSQCNLKVHRRRKSTALGKSLALRVQYAETPTNGKAEESDGKSDRRDFPGNPFPGQCDLCDHWSVVTMVKLLTKICKYERHQIWSFNHFWMLKCVLVIHTPWCATWMCNWTMNTDYSKPGFNQWIPRILFGCCCGGTVLKNESLLCITDVSSASEQLPSMSNDCQCLVYFLPKCWRLTVPFSMGRSLFIKVGWMA